MKYIAEWYARLFRAAIALAIAGALSTARIEKNAETARKSVQTGLISLKALNANLKF